MAGPWERYAAQEQEPWKKYSPKDSEPEDKRPFIQKLLQDGPAGLVRGAGSIGATLLTPYDLAVGNTKSIGNPERRQAMDDAFKMLGVDTEGMAYGGGKLAGRGGDCGER